jgi:DNA repair protein RecN (Recombination protein N)
VLLELRVTGIGIIGEITWRPAPGLNVITGETGAGKSLVVDAIAALLSGQLAGDEIRHGSDEAEVEGIFLVPPQPNTDSFRKLLADRGLAAEDDTLVMTANFRRHGRTTSRVNRQAISREILRVIGDRLVDIHGQSEHLSLLSTAQHLDFLDCYAHTWELRSEFNNVAAKLAQVDREIEALVKNEQEFARQVEFLRFQINEIEEARLREEEEAELERERTLLESGEQLKTAAGEIHRLICGDEGTAGEMSALSGLARAASALKQMADKDPNLSSQLEYLEGAVYGLTELASDLRAYGERLEYDPQRLEEVETRLQLIRDLKRKYGQSITEVLDFQKAAETKLADLSDSESRRTDLEKTREVLREELGALAARLSRERTLAAAKLAAAAKVELDDLNMAQIEFAVSVAQEKAKDGIPFPDGESYQLKSEGVDSVEFRAATNPGEPMKPLAAIASTGEVSRFMLALKGALAEADTIPVLIFDEIDIGVGGRSGEVIGKKLWKLARGRQVICVTHLPQIAAFADAHYHVHKETTGSRTLSQIQAVEGESRVNELALMLAGAHYTAASLKTASELINKAQHWKDTLDK